MKTWVGMTREQLIDEAKKLRDGIREHRDSTCHELCWHHPGFWGLLPERTDPIPEVPEWPQFMEGCINYRKSLDRQLPNAPADQGSLSTLKSECRMRQSLAEPASDMIVAG